MSGTEYWAKKCAEKEAEIERLRAALTEILRLYDYADLTDTETLDLIAHEAQKALDDHRADKEQRNERG